MNKYQEAILILKKCEIEYVKQNYYVPPKTIVETPNTDILCKLVDRATPKKPVIDIIKVGDKPREMYHCICGCTFLFNGNFCIQCGQAIDWSDE